MEVFLRKEPKMPGAYKTGTAISSPRIAGEKLLTLGFGSIRVRGRWNTAKLMHCLQAANEEVHQSIARPGARAATTKWRACEVAGAVLPRPMLSGLEDLGAQYHHHSAVWRFPLEPFFEITLGILCSGIDNMSRN